MYILYNNVCVYGGAVCSVVFDFVTSWLLYPWNFPGKNTGVGCHFLLQGTFPTRRWSLDLLCLLHCRQIFFTTGATWEAQKAEFILMVVYICTFHSPDSACPCLPHCVSMSPFSVSVSILTLQIGSSLPFF